MEHGLLKAFLTSGLHFDDPVLHGFILVKKSLLKLPRAPLSLFVLSFCETTNRNEEQMANRPEVLLFVWGLCFANGTKPRSFAGSLAVVISSINDRDTHVCCRYQDDEVL